MCLKVVPGGEEEVRSHALHVAAQMAGKSPLAMFGTKHVLLQSRDCTVNESLHHVAVWNSAQLISDDLKTFLKCLKEKRLPVFSKL
jgi:enoyl-CoA hydratase/carnithine racemase